MANAFQSDAFQNSAFQSGQAFTLDAVLRRSQSGSATLDAVFSQPTVASSFTLDAVVLAPIANIRQVGTRGAGLGAVTMALPILADSRLIAYVSTRGNPSTLTRAGWSVIGGIIATAASPNDQHYAIWCTAGVETGNTSLTFGGLIAGGGQTVVLELDGVGDLRQALQTRQTQNSQPSTLPLTNDVLPGSLVVGLYTMRPPDGVGTTGTPDAGWTEVVENTPDASGLHPWDYVVARVAAAAGPLTAGATSVYNWTGDFGAGYAGTAAEFPVAIAGNYTLDAVLRTTTSGSFTAGAVLKKTRTSSFTLDARIAGPYTLATLTLDAVLQKGRTGSYTLDAVLFQLALLYAFDAVIKKTRSTSFTLDAVIPTQNRTFGAYTLNAVLFGRTESTFNLRAWIKRGTTGITGEAGIRIKVGGIDVGSDVIFEDATFTMQTNGAPGSFHIRIRDLGHTRDFTTGAEVTLDIEGYRKFGGYLTQASRVYAFPVDDTTVPSTTERFWSLTGVDYNILFSKRIVYDKANPANVILRSWPAGSHDDVVIRYIFDHYTDLGADGVTYDGVTHVGTPNPDYRGVVSAGSHTFGDALREVNSLINGVFYIDPYKDLHFVDVETVDAANALSDRPDGGESSFRQFEHVENGAKLVNDAMVWGAGTGSTSIAFARVQDAASQAAHGLWQYGEFTSQLYKQASVNQRADSIVNGSVQSKRGGKDDQVSWSVTTFDWSFSVGEKVQIESESWGVSDIVPIRRLTVRFPTPTDPKLELLLSHEIDQPWNFYEFFFPTIGIHFDPFIIQFPTLGDFDAQDAHWYFGTLSFSSSGVGFARTDEPYPNGVNTSFYIDANMNGALFQPNLVYTVAIGLIKIAIDYAPRIGFVEAVSYPIFSAIFNFNGPSGHTIGYGGNFLSNPLLAPDTRLWAAADLAAGSTPEGGGHTANLTWWVDPPDWVPPVTPLPGQHVINDLNISDGTTTSYFTQYAYEPGTLVVTVNGVITAVTETDPATGEFTFAVAPPIGSSIVASYNFAGTGGGGAFQGPAIEVAARIDSTHYQLSFPYVAGSTEVWVDGVFQRPGIAREYTESTPETGVIEFADPVGALSYVVVSYFANGAL
jgi:hypothetical protein